MNQDNTLKIIAAHFKWPLIIFGFIAALLSLGYTILFNVNQAESLRDKTMLALTGVVQDGMEYPFIAIGLVLLFMVKGAGWKILGGFMFIVGSTLLLWSIAATYGTNSSIIAESVSGRTFEEQRLEAAKEALKANTMAVQTLQANAEAGRDRAAQFGKGFRTKGSEVLTESNQIAQQAAAQANQSMGLLKEMDSIDKDELTKINSAELLFKKLATASGMPPEYVETTFLLTRSFHLEFIVGLTVLLGIMLLLKNGKAPQDTPKARGRMDDIKEKFTEGANRAIDNAAKMAGAGAATVATAHHAPAGSKLMPEQPKNIGQNTPAKSPEPVPEQAGTQKAESEPKPVDVVTEAKKSYPMIKAAHEEGLVEFLVSTHVGNHVAAHRDGAGLPQLHVTDTLKVASQIIKWIKEGELTEETIDNLTEMQLKERLYGYKSNIHHKKFKTVWIDVATSEIVEANKPLRTRHGCGAELIIKAYEIAQLFKLVTPKREDHTRERLEKITATEAEDMANEFKEMVTEWEQEQS